MYKEAAIVMALCFLTQVEAMEETQKTELIEAASLARHDAYAPYSKYLVGAALITGDGTVFTGANVENSSYGLACCAERVAIFKAVTSGKRDIQAIAVATKDGGSPCGACRQVLNEFNPSMEIFVVNGEGKKVLECTLQDLLPQAFGPQNLID